MLLFLHLEIPFASFRQSHARDYAETYPVPPPATVYGMLLSMLGETNRNTYIGVEIAIGQLGQAPVSVIIQTQFRLKRKDYNDSSNYCPDHKELLSNLDLFIGVKGEIVEPIITAFSAPEKIHRFAGLSLGESDNLINSVRLCPDLPLLNWLVISNYGEITLPYWVDHITSIGTLYKRYTWSDKTTTPPPNAWTTITSSHTTHTGLSHTAHNSDKPKKRR